MKAMELNVVVHKGVPFGLGPLGEAFLTEAENSSRLVEACGNAMVARIVLYPENLPKGFFDLSTRIAGEVLNKLRMYRIRLAVIRTPGLKLSRHFGEMLVDERRYGYFALYESLEEAMDWLSRG